LPSSAGACAESRRIVRRRTNGMYAKAWVVLRFPLPRLGAVWALACGLSLVAGGAIEPCSVPGRGSQSYR
jgi:hypothetical protein